jgi:hypothetical protein
MLTYADEAGVLVVEDQVLSLLALSGDGTAYADVCWRMLTYAGVCWRMLTYAGVLVVEEQVCRRMPTYADVCRRMLTYADVF